MGAAPEVRLVVKHTFLEFVEDGTPVGRPFRQRVFTDSALAREGGCRRQHPLNSDADSLASPVELPSYHVQCETSASSSGACNSGGFHVNQDATQEVKAVLGMTPQGSADAAESERRPPGGPPGGRNRAVGRPHPDVAAGTKMAVASGAPVLQAGISAPPPQGSTWMVPMHAWPITTRAYQGATNAKQSPAAAKARPAQRGGLYANASAGPHMRPDAEGGADPVARIPEGQLTTVLFRNLPRSFTRAMFVDLVDAEGFAGAYNFIYVPVDFTSQAGLGYSFINLTTPAIARLFWDHFDGFSNWSVPNDKTGALNWSSPNQGLTAHVERYRNSPVMHGTVPEEWKPAVFVNGVQVAFPAPTKAIKAPKIRHAA